MTGVVVGGSHFPTDASSPALAVNEAEAARLALITTEQFPEPLQSPPHPSNVPVVTVAVSVRVVPLP
jgi:hypothetical protein